MNLDIPQDQKNVCSPIKRTFCATTYIINRDKKFVMLLHRKLNKWVPPGGKIDPHETPEETAIRECYEETGMTVKLLGAKPPVKGGLITPLAIQLNPLIPNQCDYIDFIYIGQPVGSELLRISKREAKDIGWFAYDEILNLKISPSVTHFCKMILENDNLAI